MLHDDDDDDYDLWIILRQVVTVFEFSTFF